MSSLKTHQVRSSPNFSCLRHRNNNQADCQTFHRALSWEKHAFKINHAARATANYIYMECDAICLLEPRKVIPIRHNSKAWILSMLLRCILRYCILVSQYRAHSDNFLSILHPEGDLDGKGTESFPTPLSTKNTLEILAPYNTAIFVGVFV